jgi:hypothetical protein
MMAWVRKKLDSIFTAQHAILFSLSGLIALPDGGAHNGGNHATPSCVLRKKTKEIKEGGKTKLTAGRFFFLFIGHDGLG